MNSISKSQYGVSEKESITFDKDNKVTSFKLESGTSTLLNQTVTYDKLGRMTAVGTALNGSATQSPFLAKAYEFKAGEASGTTTTLVSKETNGGAEKNYTYDAKGNILSISSSAGTITYTYDLISQLTKETNGITGEIIDYTYDTGGNILSKTITKDGVSRTYNYGYNDSNWKDKLTSFDGQNILYGQIGNPLSLNGATLGWTQGRKLSTYNKDGTTAYYTYDENGIRKSKYVNGTTTEYLTSGGEVVAKKTGSNVTTYTRGADGSLISMNRNGTIYYYQTNLQGDVEKILDGSGTAVVNYMYDAFGRITSMTGDQTLGQENPFRYRSYFFDQESGFYYLQSRYYDPMMGRFISADSQINPDVNGGNVFAYCGNNPVKNIDPEGNVFWMGILLPVITLAIGISATVGAWIYNKDMNTTADESSARPVDPYPGGGVEENPNPRYVSQRNGAEGHNDEEWSDMDAYLQKQGCAIASTVMALSFLSIVRTPNQLYALNGNSVEMRWKKAYDTVIVGSAGYSTADIDAALQLYLDDPARYAPPIVRVKPMPNSHFAVIISGGDGHYMTWDPWDGIDTPFELTSTDRIITYYK